MNHKLVAITGALMLSQTASDNVTYFVEQLDPASVDTYHYKVQFRPEELLPDVDVQAVSMNVGE